MSFLLASIFLKILEREISMVSGKFLKLKFSASFMIKEYKMYHPAPPSFVIEYYREALLIPTHI